MKWPWLFAKTPNLFCDRKQVDTSRIAMQPDISPLHVVRDTALRLIDRDARFPAAVDGGIASADPRAAANRDS
jgi:hypothetical protein